MGSHNTGLVTPSTLGESTKEEYTKPNITITNLVENLANKPHHKSVYDQQLSRLKSTFPDIPEDLTNKKVMIRYKQDNWRFPNVFLYSDHLVVGSIDGKNISIRNIKWKCEWSASFYSSTERGLLEKSDAKFIPSGFRQGIKKIIKNADKCEIKIEELKRPQL